MTHTDGEEKNIFNDITKYDHLLIFKNNLFFAESKMLNKASYQIQFVRFYVFT